MATPAKIAKHSNGFHEDENVTCNKYQNGSSQGSLKRKPISKEEAIRMRGTLIGRATQIHFPEDPLKITHGKGPYLYDENGVQYLDCMNNVAHVGHCHPHVVKAGQRQMEFLETNSRFLHDELLIYAQRLTSLLPDKLCVCFLVCTGTEANDLALRMSRTFTKNEDVVVLDRAYHGHSVAITDISPYKFKRLGKQKEHVHVCPCPDSYRGLFRGDNNDTSISEKYANEFQKTIDAATAKDRKIAAFYAESLQSCGGQIIYPPGFLKKAFESTRRAGGVCIADEVQVGFGRVGSAFWGFELHGVVPDIVTMGKPMGNGHPVSAVITTQEIADAFEGTKVAYFNTFGGNPVSCSVANAVLDVIEDEGLQQHAKQLGDYWISELVKIKNSFPLIGDVRGVGLFIGIEIVTDLVNRTPATALARSITQRMRKKGVLISVDGPDVNVLKIKPPMVITKEDVDHFLKVFHDVMTTIENNHLD